MEDRQPRSARNCQPSEVRATRRMVRMNSGAPRRRSRRCTSWLTRARDIRIRSAVRPKCSSSARRRKHFSSSRSIDVPQVKWIGKPGCKYVAIIAVVPRRALIDGDRADNIPSPYSRGRGPLPPSGWPPPSPTVWLAAGSTFSVPRRGTARSSTMSSSTAAPGVCVRPNGLVVVSVRAREHVLDGGHQCGATGGDKGVRGLVCSSGGDFGLACPGHGDLVDHGEDVDQVPGRVEEPDALGVCLGEGGRRRMPSR